jgi:D-alanine-D-alanine ligase
MIKTSIIVAYGGASPEHEVSVLTAMQAMAALEQEGYNLVPLYISKSGKWFTGDILKKLELYTNLEKLTQNAVSCSFTHNEYGAPVLQEMKSGLFSKAGSWPVHAVLTAFHGSDGENGSFQGICEMYNIPYTGSGVLASSVGMDKVKAKTLCKVNDIPVVEGTDFYEGQWVDNREEILAQIEKLEYPVIVKPVNLGSSIGITVVKNRNELHNAIELAFRYDEHLLVEKVIHPLMEINCSVMGTPHDCKASVCERPVGRDELLSFRDKYMSDEGSAKGMASADRVIPADISDELTKKIQDTAVQVFKTLGASGLARLDFLVQTDTHQLYFNEINTIPGSFSFYLWDKSGISFNELLKELINIATERNRQKNGRVQSYETNLLNQKAVKGIKGLKGSKS